MKLALGFPNPFAAVIRIVQVKTLLQSFYSTEGEKTQRASQGVMLLNDSGDHLR